MKTKIEITEEQARDYMLLIDDKLRLIQESDGFSLSPATIRRLSATYDLLSATVNEVEA